ncbi:MAG: hypothetical protein JSU63_17135 [Phycisphaerales bacterium]|nr:MAG: hypothetical protein JSU63_17135 [Phycisphaerales bacterium]
MNWVESLLTSLGGAGAIMAVAGLWLRKYVDRKMASSFDARDREVQGRVDIALHLRRQRLTALA